MLCLWNLRQLRRLRTQYLEPEFRSGSLWWTLSHVKIWISLRIVKKLTDLLQILIFHRFRTEISSRAFVLARNEQFLWDRFALEVLEPESVYWFSFVFSFSSILSCWLFGSYIYQVFGCVERKAEVCALRAGCSLFGARVHSFDFALERAPRVWIRPVKRAELLVSSLLF